jgi:predicted methyltransferase
MSADMACAAGVSGAIAAAVTDAGRPAADKDRDADRKPAESLAFAGVKPGLVVGELLPGGGYFTRLISKVVGASGHVYVLVPPRPPTAPADRPDMAARIKVIADDPAYGNVSVIVGPLADFNLPAQVDLFWTSLNYHDLHNVPGMDLTAFNKRVFDALKPGGIYLVLDHAAAAGSGTRDTSTLHRIDRDTVKQEVLAAGFVAAGSSDILHRAEDPHTAPVRDASVQGKTDQFILKFRKPVTMR